MAKYLLRVPVSGDEYYVVEADSVEEAISLANQDPYDLAEPVETDVVFDGEFELQDIIEPGEDD